MNYIIQMLSNSEKFNSYIKDLENKVGIENPEI